MLDSAKTQHLAGTITEALRSWQQQFAYDQGVIIDNTISFKLSEGSKTHQINAGWINRKDWEAAHEQIGKDEVPIFCPDFLVKLTASDPESLSDCQNEMATFRDNGCPLGWLIEPEHEQVYIFKPNEQIHQIPTFDYYLDGRDVLKGFEFPLKGLRY